jgi:hypothetical protein
MVLQAHSWMLSRTCRIRCLPHMNTRHHHSPRCHHSLRRCCHSHPFRRMTRRHRTHHIHHRRSGSGSPWPSGPALIGPILLSAADVAQHGKDLKPAPIMLPLHILVEKKQPQSAKSIGDCTTHSTELPLQTALHCHSRQPWCRPHSGPSAGTSGLWGLTD